MKKLMTFAVFAALIGWSQQIDSVTVRQRWPWSKLVDINYVLTAPIGESYDVTIQAFNGEEPVTIPPSAFGGDVYGVTEGARHIVLDPSKIVSTNVQMMTQFKVQLGVESSPLYVVVDLVSGATEKITKADLESGVYGTVVTNTVAGTQTVVWSGMTNNADYKLNKMVFRRIPAGTFTMGKASGIYAATSEKIHTVVFTRPFYMGVFECTQGQWWKVTGSWVGYWNNGECRTNRPLESASYQQIRGTNSWPIAESIPDGNSFLRKLNDKTGLLFDLPTDAQWEYACRAGTTSDYNNGGSAISDLNLLGRYRSNGGRLAGQAVDPPQSVGITNATAWVGSYLSNAWGLYDMHGNVNEWCLDWYTSDNSSFTSDPVGPLTQDGTYGRVFRGGTYNGSEDACRSARRVDWTPANWYTASQNSYGFRAVLRLP